MKKLFTLLSLVLASTAFAVDVKISQLPLGSASTAGINDSFPYLQASTNITKRLTLWDLINLPPMVSTYAPKASPTFTGTVTAPTFVGALTGNASTASALAANPTDCASNTFANAIVANGNLTCAAVGDAALSTSYVKADGTRALSASWNAGAFTITANSVGVGSAANTINGLSTTINGSGTLNHNSTGTITIPNATDTLVGKATTDTLTNKTLTAPVISSIVNTGTLTLPTSTDTLVGKATTDTLTNKTISSGSNTITLAASTVTSGTLATARGGTNLDSSASTGVAKVSSGTWSVATITNADVASNAAISTTKIAKTTPTIQTFTSGSGNYTTPANVLYIRVRAVGGGGGGSGGGSGAGTGTSGGSTTFGTSMINCGGGVSAGQGANAAVGGTCTLGTGPIGVAQQGAPTTGIVGSPAGQGAQGGIGGSSPFGGGGGGSWSTNTGVAAAANSGSGGGGGGCGANSISGQGGSSGGYADAIIVPTASQVFPYAVGAAGSGGSAGTAGGVGGAGAAGYIIVEEFYQ